MILYLDKDVIVIEKSCPFCGERSTCSFPTDGFEKWILKGELIQKAMPTVPAASREFLISGLCSKCQERTFGEEE